MGKINVLSFAVANLIAAGEVVDRPASVVKELMENSIDAGATRITVEIQNGGVTLLRVTDNGCGMDREDLPVSVRRHATSKIKDPSDLDAIITLGFRGEALAATCAVADVRIISKPREAASGAKLTVHGGEIVSLTEQGCADGTTVIVENLFMNVPARRKFLKKDVTEAMAVTANVERVAVSHPEIAFQLIIDGNLKLETVGDGQLKSAIWAVFGKDFATRLIPVSGEFEDVKVSGFIGRTDNVKANRNYENFFINGRYVKSKTAMAAVEQAFVSYLPQERFPVCVLFLELNPARVDVNVHPAKLEVKFSNEKPVFEAIYYGVRTALEQNVTRPNLKLPQQSGRVSDRTVPVVDGRAESLGKLQLSVHSNPSASTYEHVSAAEYCKKYAEDADMKPSTSAIPSLRRSDAPLPPSRPISTVTESKIETKIEPTTERQKAPALMPQNSVADDVPAVTEAQSEPPHPYAVKGEYRIIGEAFHSYVLVEVGEKLLLIDKHAAHERLIFEKLKANMNAVNVPSKQLLLPVEVLLMSDEVGLLEAYRGEMESVGFSFRSSRNTVFVDAMPEGIEASDLSDLLVTVAGHIKNETGNVKLTREIIFEKALYQASCKAAIKAGREYPPEYTTWLVDQMMQLPDITFCPHGRPVALELSRKNLDHQFERT